MNNNTEQFIKKLATELNLDDLPDVSDEESGHPFHCIHKNTQKTRRVLSNGVVTVSLQCLACGSGVRSLKRSGENLDALPAFNEQLRDDWMKRWTRYRTEQQDLNDRRESEFWLRYNDYLRSDHWRKIRISVLARDPLCQRCFSVSSQVAHHVSYESFKRFGLSFAIECVGLCHKCHDNLHNQSNENHSP